MNAHTIGPAFPCEFVAHASGSIGNNVDIMGKSSGMTLRDYFAAKAIVSILAMPDGGIQSHHPDDHIDNSSATRVAAMWAEQAYQVADAMIAERAK